MRGGGALFLYSTDPHLVPREVGLLRLIVFDSLLASNNTKFAWRVVRL